MIINNVFNKSNVISSLLWKLMERGGTQGIQFIVQIILARLLSPEQFGTVAIVMVFVNLAQVFVQTGFNTSLIQKKNADELDFSSIFYFGLFIASLLYILIFFTSPYIANFYDQEVLIPVLRVLALTLFFGAINSVQNAYIARQMMFKKLFSSSLAAILVSGLVGIITAYMGFGIWALVVQHLLNQALVSLFLWYSINWRPRMLFSIKRVKNLLAFGWKLLVSSLLETLYVDLRTLIIGRLYTSSALAYYNRGQQFPHVIVSNINGSIQSVMLPALSAHQDNKTRVKSLMRRSIVTSSFLIFPTMVGLAAVAEPLVEIVLTETWLSAVPFLQIFCFTYVLMPIQSANIQAINAIGRSDIYLKISVVKRIYGLVILLISMQYGVYAITIGQLLIALISSFINAYPNKILLDYSYKDQLMDIFPSMILSIIMGGIVFLISYIDISNWLMLILQISTGTLIYISLASLFNLEAFNYLNITVRQFVASKKLK